jgi:hypothetical protein
MRSLEFEGADTGTSRLNELQGYAPAGDYVAASIAGPDALSPLFPVLLVAVVAATRLRRAHSYAHLHRLASRRPERPDEDSASWQLSNTQFCPICCAEYLSGTERCEDCAVQLVDEEELPETDLRIEEGVVRIACIRNTMQGHLVRGFLASNRIPCSLTRCTPWDVLGTDVYVFESDAVRAKRLLRTFLAELERR